MSKSSRPSTAPARPTGIKPVVKKGISSENKDTVALLPLVKLRQCYVDEAKAHELVESEEK